MLQLLPVLGTLTVNLGKLESSILFWSNIKLLSRTITYSDRTLQICIDPAEAHRRDLFHSIPWTNLWIPRYMIDYCCMKQNSLRGYPWHWFSMPRYLNKPDAEAPQLRQKHFVAIDTERMHEPWISFVTLKALHIDTEN